MTNHSLPMPSLNGDRKVGSAAWRFLFQTFFKNGIFANPSTNLQVLEADNMRTVVKAGRALINGTFMYEDQDLIFQHDIADGLLKRIDRIVVRLDYVNRLMTTVLKKGTFASAPVAPTIQRDAEAYEIVLADVFIGNGVTQITQAVITDQRLNSALCGVVTGTVDEVDTTTLFNQYQSWFAQQKAAYESDFATWTAEQKQEFEDWQTLNENQLAAWKNEFETTAANWFAQEQQDFETWFATLQDLLDGNLAATLTAKVQALETGKANSEDLTQLQTQVTEHLAEMAQHNQFMDGSVKKQISFGANNTLGCLTIKISEVIE